MIQAAAPVKERMPPPGKGATTETLATAAANCSARRASAAVTDLVSVPVQI